MLLVIAKAKTNAGKEQDLLNITKSLIAETRKEAGCLGYDLYQNTESSVDFAFIEQWESDAALNAHSTSAHFVKFQKEADGVVADLDIKKYNI